MPESLLLTVVSGVVGKAADELVQSITRMWGVDGDRHRLERQLLAVQSLLTDAEAKSETKPAVKAWMKDLKAAAYRADDVLDHFQYEALRRKAQGRRSMSRKVLSHFTRDNPLLFRFKVSRELKNVLNKIDDLVEEMNKFGLVENMEAPQTIYRQTHSALDESEEIHGRDDDKAVVVKLLLDQQDQKDVHVLPIIGIGGLGKTTLAKMVYNDNRVHEHFELKMWHCVSENFEATAVVRSVIELATNKRCELHDTIELLRVELHKAIGRKRFLLVLDDVWNEEQRKWEDDLKPLLCSSIGGSGSMIVVTSRSLQVDFIMGTLPPYKPACLSEDDSWKLFSMKAFSKGVKEQAELVTIGRCIVSKCKGLPLALKVMGGLMSSKQQVQEWKSIADCNISDTNRGKDEVMSILKLSYRHLSSEMKQCFAFCALYPKDYEMEKDKLIQLWMANGYIHEEGTMDLEQRGEFIFNYLIWGSFLQVVIFERVRFGPSKLELCGCKMHDLMHDLANDVAHECADAKDLIQQNVSIKDVRHLHVSESHQLKKICRKGTIYLRTLLTPPSSSYKDIMESKLMTLRALRCFCKDPSIISRQLIRTTHLRYLDLSGSEIVRLPDSICMLYNLQTLRLNDCCRLQYLPEDMRTMRKLRHLYLLGCDDLKRMPPELGLLQNLHTLTTFVVDTEDGCGIEQLKDLRQLGNRLDLRNLRKAKSGSKADLQGKQNLSELLLHWSRNKFYGHGIDELKNEEVLESLVPHGKLKILEVYGYGGLEISQWMRDPQMFQCLRKLIIAHCPRCKDLPIVWMSSCLEHLSLHSMDSITILCKNIEVEARRHNTSLQIFPKLKRLELRDLPQLVRWTENSAAVTFPLLEELTIIECNKLASLPDCPILARLSYFHEKNTVRTGNYTSAEGLVSMSLPLGSWPYLVELNVGRPVNIVMPPEEHQGQRPLENLRSLAVSSDDSFFALFHLKLRDCFAFVVKLQISSCLNIVRWPVDAFRCLPALRSLEMSDCPNLVGDGSSSEEIFPLPPLKELSILYCDSLQEIPEVPASLEVVFINENANLVALSGLVNLANLRALKIHRCRGLKVLPDGMEGLTSLEWLLINDCPGIEKFPRGLLPRLTTLRILAVYNCPNLQRRCRVGGEYFDLISSIPNLHIDPAERSL